MRQGFMIRHTVQNTCRFYKFSAKTGTEQDSQLQKTFKASIVIKTMLKKIIHYFKKPVKPDYTEIELSKIDKHMNFILRDNLGAINKEIQQKVTLIEEKKQEIIQLLRDFHKAHLMNAKIHERERQIMEGNRDNYIKRIAHFVNSISVPKNYLEAYDYALKFSTDIEELQKDIQKNIFVLGHFFQQETKAINHELYNVEEIIIDIRVYLEKNHVETLKEVQKHIKSMTTNTLKIKDITGQIATENAEIKIHQDKINKLKERIRTITTGTDYQALESFKDQKEAYEKEIKILSLELQTKFSEVETALKKYYYKNSEKKIIRSYLDNATSALVSDTQLEIASILVDVKSVVEQDGIDLKDKKKEQCIAALDELQTEYLKTKQVALHKLELEKSLLQTKITHNSASLNLSEQQYWINSTEEKIKGHEEQIRKLKERIEDTKKSNQKILDEIQKLLENIFKENVVLIDDITDKLLTENTL